MPLLVNSVPNLAQGVSQQPDNLRYPGQCDEQINAWATVVEGLVKRPHTSYIKNVGSSQPSNLFTHFVKRDETNKYVIAVSLGGVSAHNLSLGTSYNVAVTSIASSYLSLGGSVTNPLKDIRALTVADYTFIVNKKVEVEKSRNNSLSNVPPPEALIAVKLGDYDKAYSIFIDDQLVMPGGTKVDGGSIANSEHDYTHTNEVPSTYISGRAGHSDGKYADTNYIAADLASCISAQHATSRVSIDDITITNGGSGWLKNLYINRTKNVTRLFYSESQTYREAIPESVPKKLTFSVLQTTAGVDNRSAKGYCKVSNGVIEEFIFDNRGSGYDPSGTFTLELEQRYSLNLKFFGKTVWARPSGNSTPVTQPTYSTLTTKINPPLRVQREGSLIKVVKSLTVSNGGGYYILKQEHTSTADNEPGTGANAGIYWEQTSVSAGSAAWASGVDYKFNEDIDVRVEDGLANQGLDALYKETSSITDLPKKCFNKFIIKIKGDADIAQDDYYVRFQTKDGNDYGEGSWVETIGWNKDDTKSQGIGGIDTELEDKTMPCTLLSYFNTDGTINSFRLQSPGERLIVKNGSNYYYLIEAHNSSSTNEPGVGADSEEYWASIDQVTQGFIEWSSGVYYYDNYKDNKYAARAAGDDFTNPFPSFVGQTINDVFFFKNRLGFLTNNAVIFSEADAYFNFFRTTTQQLLDSAPIDVGLSHTKVAVLQHAIPFQEKLMLFSKQSQFVLRGADILSPKTVAISPVTEYDISDSINPLAVGNYIYFTFQRNDYEGVYEYFVDNNTETFNAEEITQQIPKYINKKATRIVGSPAENTLVITTDDDLKTLFVYKYFWSNKEKIQSAWMKFTFDRDIVGCDFIDSKLFMLTSDTEGLHLESLTLEDGLKDSGLDYTLYLDSRVEGSTLTTSYDATTKKTTISGLPYDPTNLEIYTKIGTKRELTVINSTLSEKLTNGDFSAVTGTNFDNWTKITGAYDTVKQAAGILKRVAGTYTVVRQNVSLTANTRYKLVFDWSTTGNTASGSGSINFGEDTTWEASGVTGVSHSINKAGGDVYYFTTGDTPPTRMDMSIINDDYEWNSISLIQERSVEVTGDITSVPFFAGKPYNMLYRFSDQTLKQPTERGGRSASDYTYQTIRSGSLNYADTGHFTVEVTPKYRDTYSYAFNPDIVGANLSLNEFTPQNGHFRFPVQAQPNEVTIEVKSSSALPVKLLAAEFESMFIPRSRRYGS